MISTLLHESFLSSNDCKYPRLQDTEQGHVDGQERPPANADDQFAFSNEKDDIDATEDTQPRDELTEVPLDEARRGSEAVEQSIEEIRIKMETFTDMVSLAAMLSS